MIDQIRSELSELWERALTLLSGHDDTALAVRASELLRARRPEIAAAAESQARALAKWFMDVLRRPGAELPGPTSSQLQDLRSQAFLLTLQPESHDLGFAPETGDIELGSAFVRDIAGRIDATKVRATPEPNSRIPKTRAARRARSARPARGEAASGDSSGPVLATVEAVARAQPEPVLLGVSAPRSARPGEAFTVRFAAYVKGLQAQTEKKLQALADVDVALGYAPSAGARWSIGTPVVVRLTGEHFTCTPASQRFEWNGTEHVLSFLIKTAVGAPKGKTQLCFEAYIEDIQVSLIIVDIALGARARPGTQSARDTPMTTAFASYASRDTARVMDKLSALRSYDRGLDIFVDCLDLSPGEVWKDKLRREIAARDRFLLFWSVAASASKWVGWEWRQAVEAQKPIQPMPLDSPQRAPLPKQLAKLHGYDKFQLVRDAASRRAPSKKRIVRGSQTGAGGQAPARGAGGRAKPPC